MNLTQKVLEFQRNPEIWQELYKELYKACRTFFSRTGKDPELAHEVFFYSLNRLERTCRIFKFQDKPFEHYLHQCLSWQVKSYQRSQQAARRKEESAYSACAKGGILSTVSDQVAESVPEYGTAQWDAPSRPEKITCCYRDLDRKSRHILLLALYNFWYLDDWQLNQVCAKAGIDLSWLESMVDRLRVLSIEVFEKRQQAVDRRYANHLVGRKSMTRGTFIPGTSFHPYHRDIAQVLGIPKGTVDSTLFYIRKQALKLQTQADHMAVLF